MRAVVQRAERAKVTVSGEVVGEIGPGAVVLVGISPEDGLAEAEWLADKVSNLRIYNDVEGKMNRSLAETGGDVLLVSQFTLYGDARRGRRPSFVRAAAGTEAEEVYEACAAALRTRGLTTATGTFGAMMSVELVNDGPVTILLDSERTF